MTETRSDPSGGGGASPGQAKRTKPVLFYRQVVGELRKVVWPTRHQLLTYTGVVLVFVAVMVAIVTLLDYAFKSAVLALFGQ